MPKFNASLSVDSIRQLQKDLTAYRDSLPEKCRRFVVALSEAGIAVAKQNTGNYGKYITFSTKAEPKKDGCKAIMLATETGKITSAWKTSEGIKTADVSPLLMVEFGSGWRAENPMQVPGVGQGTFPGATHSYDKEGWYWIGLDDKLYHSYGISPKMPMYMASLEIQRIAIEKAKEIFGGK